ncbi:hypothetical protein NK6_10052 [Bradyrhizobium diazoefficiens]|uniref:Uncharacterized protein n=1 Tax=Bradyrhizobium diazoefficiens TaxID=1355477 RepID=A0A0E4FYW4_9BRAD|nr:hypothetical protein NK6_10052 [Bradyrhizobium diazoefficiens]
MFHLLPPVLSLNAIAGGSNTAFCGPGSGFRARRAALPQRESARNYRVLPGRRRWTKERPRPAL